MYKAHRIAWAMWHGRDPGLSLVDHINGDTLDNRAENLRLVSYLENTWNARPIANRTGFPGVQTQPYGFVARITVNKQRIHLGVFETAEEAALVYDEARRKHHGEFRRA